MTRLYRRHTGRVRPTPKGKCDRCESPRMRKLLAMSMAGIATVFVALALWTVICSGAERLN
jgi:hypothetical protein